MSDSQLFIAPFIGGLNTELSTVQDLPAYTSDELNFSVYPEGIRGRRYGMNIERDGSYYAIDKAGTTYGGFFWKNVNKTAEDFVVYQVDSTIHFYKATQKPFSAAKLEQTVDLTQYITDTGNFYLHPVKFTTGDGKLMVVSKYMEPVNISYDFLEETFTVEKIKIQYRDLEGYEDGLKVEEQPSELSNYHHYNLLNQGWSENQIEEFKKDKGRYPANNLQWWLGKDESGAYNTENLLRRYFGNTPAPKGHFVLNYFDKNRSFVSGITGGSARKGTVSFNKMTSYHDRSWHGSAAKEWSVTLPSSKGTASRCTINFTTLKTKVAKAALGNWRGILEFDIQGLISNKWTSIYIERRTLYGPEKFTLEFAEAAKKSDQYRLMVKLVENQNGTSDVPGPATVTMTFEVPIAEDGDPFVTVPNLSRVTDVAFMSGKYFYLSGDTVLFSQTVTEDNKGFDKCYQDADPTAEDVVDPLSTDGGYVKFQTMGDGLALKTFNRGVLVFGRDVVWGLISPESGRFTATEYDTVEISRAGIIGPQSVVSVADSVYYWSPLGIFRIGVNQQTGSTMVAENITQMTIQSFYNNIPTASKEACRSAFDYANNRIYWFYPLDPTKPAVLDGVLLFDLNYSAFYVFKLSEGGAVTAVFETINNYEISPTAYVKAGGVTVTAGGQFVIANEQTNKYNRYVAIQHCIINEDNEISFGDFNSREFIDWDKNGYDSYMVSRPITHEGLSRYGKEVSDVANNKQVPILQTLFKRTEEGCLNLPKEYIAPSGAMIRMRWGWSLNEHSNRWDMVQNAYRPQKDFMNDEYVESRIHIRGRGKAYQIEIRNDGNKDLRLAGINTLVRS
jgi:hypothetical protein